jgi:hypothetical protein
MMHENDGDKLYKMYVLLFDDLLVSKQKCHKNGRNIPPPPKKNVTKYLLFFTNSRKYHNVCATFF